MIKIDFKTIDSSIYIILIKKYSVAKVVRIFNNSITNIIIDLI